MESAVSRRAWGAFVGVCLVGATAAHCSVRIGDAGTDGGGDDATADATADATSDAPATDDSGSDASNFGDASGPDAGADAGSLVDGAAADAGPDASEAGACATLGSAGKGGVLDVTAFGAHPDGSDATAAIQAAITAACSMNPQPPVFLPVGTFTTTAPLVIQCQNLEIVGQCRSGSLLAPSFQGPAIFISPAGDDVDLVPALVGTGSALATEGTATTNGNYYLNLRDAPTVELDGLPQLTAEAFISLSEAYPPGFANIVSGPYEGACNSQVLGCKSALRLGVAGQNLEAEVDVAGTSVVLSGPVITLSTVHHVAVAYDGATARLFLDGAVVASAAASGAVAQGAYEDVVIGPMQYALEASKLVGAMPGTIDSVRISRVARYTGAFTPPTTKLASDGDTLALLNFDAQMPGLTRAQTRSGPAWLPVRRYASPQNQGLPFLYGAHLHDFGIAPTSGGSGIMGWSAATSHLYQLDCIDCDYGFTMFGNNYYGVLEDLTATAVTARGRYGVYTHTANGNYVHGVTLSGQTIPFAEIGGATAVLAGVSITPGANAPYDMVLFQASDALVGASLNPPVAPSSAWRGAIADVQPWSKLEVQGGTVGNAGSALPITVDGAEGVMVEGTTFTGTAGSAEIIHLASATATPSILVSTASKDSSVPWSDDPGLVTLATAVATPPSVSVYPASDPGSRVVRGLVPAASVFDVTVYGAMSDPGGPTNNFDSGPGFQAAIDAACAKGPGATVFVPVGIYFVFEPLLVHCGGITLEGASLLGSLVRTFQGGVPGFVLNPPGMTGVDVAPALVGTGSAMQTDGASEWLELRDSDTRTLELSGVSAFTAEAFVKPSGAAAGYGGIVQSRGCLGTAAPMPGCTSAFALATDAGALTASLTTTGGPVTLQGSMMSIGAVHHVAISYDGATARLFLDGAVVASAAASGPLVQAYPEDVTVGARTAGFDALATDPAMPGIIDSVRISNAGRYVSAFTPPSAKLSVDGSTLMLLNFDTQAAGCTRGLGQGGAEWLPVRRTAEPSGTPEGTIDGVTFRSLTVDASTSVFGMNATHTSFVDFATNGYEGIVLDGTSAGLSVLDSFGAQPTGGRYGILAVGADGALLAENHTNYARTELVLAGGSGQTLLSWNASPDPATSVWGAIFTGSSVTGVGVYFDNEGTMPDALGDIALSSGPLTLFKGEIDIGQGLPIVADHATGLVVEATSFGSSNGASELIDIAAEGTGVEAAVGVSPRTSAPVSNDATLQSVGN